MAAWTEGEGRFVAELFLQGRTPQEVSRLHNERFPDTPRSASAVAKARYEQEHVQQFLEELEADGDGVGVRDGPSARWSPKTGTLESKTNRVTTLPELMQAADLDPDAWEVQWVQPSKSEIGYKDGEGELCVEQLFHIKAKLDPLPGRDALRAIKDEVLEEIQTGARTLDFEPRAVADPPSDPRLAEAVLFDIHLGMLAWGQETGRPWDLDTVQRVVMDCARDLVAEASAYGVERWLLPVGNDFYHTDQTIMGKGGATTAGTPQDVDTRWQKAFGTGRRLMADVIDMMLTIAPVDVLVVPGNHDETKAWFLGEVLAAQYAANPHVRVDNRPPLRKYVRYGNTFLGFTHGKEEKVKDLPLIMATEAPEDWGRSVFREIHMGHQHRERVFEEKGVRCRFLPALTGTDAWHHRRGYVENVREARCYLWTRDRGLGTTVHRTVVPSADERAKLGPVLHDTAEAG